MPGRTPTPPIQLARIGLLFSFANGAQPLGGFGRFGHGLRRKNDEQPVIVFIVRDDLDCFCVRLRSWRRRECQPDCLDSNAAAKTCLSSSKVLLDNSASFSAAFDQRIGRKNTRAAAIGHNRQTRSCRPRLFAQQLGETKQFFDCVHAQNANAPKSSIQHVVTARERTCV